MNVNINSNLTREQQKINKWKYNEKRQLFILKKDINNKLNILKETHNKINKRQQNSIEMLPHMSNHNHYNLLL